MTATLPGYDHIHLYLYAAIGYHCLREAESRRPRPDLSEIRADSNVEEVQESAHQADGVRYREPKGSYRLTQGV